MKKDSNLWMFIAIAICGCVLMSIIATNAVGTFALVYSLKNTPESEDSFQVYTVPSISGNTGNNSGSSNVSGGNSSQQATPPVTQVPVTQSSSSTQNNNNSNKSNNTNNNKQEQPAVPSNNKTEKPTSAPTNNNNGSIKVNLPKVPFTVEQYDYSGVPTSTYKVTAINCATDDDEIEITFSCQKISDADGNSNTDNCELDLQLIDSKGNVVKSGSIYSNDMRVGQSGNEMYKESFSNIASGTYTLYAESSSAKYKKSAENYNIKLPAVPVTLKNYDYSDKLTSTFKVSNISYKVEGSYIYYIFSVSKTADTRGNGQSDVCRIACKLYDSDGNVIDTTQWESESLAVGDKVTNAKYDYACVRVDKLDPNDESRLEIISVNGID